MAGTLRVEYSGAVYHLIPLAQMSEWIGAEKAEGIIATELRLPIPPGKRYPRGTLSRRESLGHE
jgi:hypothetical protein